MTLTYFTQRSNLVAEAFLCEKVKTIDIYTPYPPHPTQTVFGGYTVLTLSFRPSVRNT